MGYTAQEVSDIVARTNFESFADNTRGVIRDALRLIRQFGFNKGDAFRKWIGQIIAERTGNARITFGEHHRWARDQGFPDLYVVGTNLSRQRAEVFSHERDDTRDMEVRQAVRISMYGRPGPVYLDLPGDIIDGKVEEEDAMPQPPRVPDPPRLQTDPEAVQAALGALRSAERPLVIVGKGAAYSRAEDEVQEFIEKTQLPYLASPMGKGLLPDDHPLSVAAGRSYALQNADLVFLIGARLNWIMHFGQPPRFAENVRVIQLDIAAEEIGTNVPTEVGLVGDAKAIVGQLNAALEEQPWQFSAENTWRTGLAKKIAENQALNEPMLNDDSVPMGYYRVLREIRDMLPRDAMLINEGASTMDIGRQVLPTYLPRHRLDAGTFGTMGVGLSYAIAAQVVDRNKRVVAVEGDSAFGFSGMEVEVACRYNLPITFIVINNNGIGGGPSELDPNRVLPMAYTPNAHYEKVIEAFGGLGFFCEKPDEIRPALEKAFASGKPSIVNIMIDARARRKPQEHAWLTR
ncbi:MAG: hypothetical protein IIB21_06545, partial [Chloroflexi bacterium]|nr:hypothetical protein [Chloroflexota bacterium]